jgi:hypothetical protein
MSKKQIKVEAFDPSAGSSSHKLNIVSVAKSVTDAYGGEIAQSHDSTYANQIKFAWVPLSKCYINYRRQRWPEPSHIKKLLSKWNIICATPLQARYSKAEDRYYIADGQQHGIAWVIKYGADANVPVAYVESEDENVESEMLLALNTGNEPMKPYFIHKQEVIMGIPEAVDLENCVTAAGCQVSYRKRSAGCITNIGHLYIARDTFKLPELELGLIKMKQHWPTKYIQTDTLRGLLHIRKLMKNANTYTDDLFDDVIRTVKVRYVDESGVVDAKVLFNAVQEQCRVNLETTSIDAESKLASGILSVYEQVKGQDIVAGHRPFKDLVMPVIK